MTKRHRRGREDFGGLPASGRPDEKFGREPWSPHDKDEAQPKKCAALKPKTPAQADYIAHLRSRTLTFGLGSAGSGKTFCAVAVACEKLKAKEIDKIVCTRPAVEAEEDLGYLPGEIGDKFSPYFAPLREIFIDRLGESYLTYCIRKGKIVAAPFAYMRGWTFARSFVILDEAQNTTPGQMKLLLTRLGEGTFCAVNGDETQSDLKTANGLDDAARRMQNHRDVGYTRFTVEDVVRSGFVADVLERYNS